MCVCISECARVCLNVGVAVALLSSLESILIKKDWFCSKREPEGSRLHCKHVLKQSSHGGSLVGWTLSSTLFLKYSHEKSSVQYWKKVLYARVIAVKPGLLNIPLRARDAS